MCYETTPSAAVKLGGAYGDGVIVAHGDLPRTLFTLMYVQNILILNQ